VSTEDVRRYGADMVQAKSAMALYGPVGDAPDLEAVLARLAA
jgi:hypothetical protein